jgi:hypothetical protein
MVTSRMNLFSPSADSTLSRGGWGSGRIQQSLQQPQRLGIRHCGLKGRNCVEDRVEGCVPDVDQGACDVDKGAICELGGDQGVQQLVLDLRWGVTGSSNGGL